MVRLGPEWYDEDATVKSGIAGFCTVWQGIAGQGSIRSGVVRMQWLGKMRRDSVG